MLIYLKNKEHVGGKGVGLREFTKSLENKNLNRR